MSRVKGSLKMRFIKLVLIGAGLMILSSCATMPPGSSRSFPFYPPLGVPRQDMIHIVAPGETLWRISQVYDVDIEAIMQANKLNKREKLAMGQKLIIPRAMPACSLISLISLP